MPPPTRHHRANRTLIHTRTSTLSVLLAALFALCLLPSALSASEAEEPGVVGEASAVQQRADGSSRTVTVLVDTGIADPESVLQEVAPWAPAPGEEPRAEAAFAKWAAWDFGDIPVKIGYNPADARPGIELEPVLQAMLEAWNAVDGHSFRFEYTGVTTAPPGNCNEPGGPDGLNVVGWRRDLPKGTLAVTCREDVPGANRGVVAEMDVAFAVPIKWSTDDQTPKDSFDLPSTVIHELGHVLGLDHSTEAGSVMRASIGPGIQRRTLSADEVAGIGSLYPPGDSPATSAPLPVLNKSIVIVGLGRD